MQFDRLTTLSKTWNNIFRYLENVRITLFLFLKFCLLFKKVIKFRIESFTTKRWITQNYVMVKSVLVKEWSPCSKIISYRVMQYKNVIKVHSFFDNVKEALLTFWISNCSDTSLNFGHFQIQEKIWKNSEQN